MKLIATLMLAIQLTSAQRYVSRQLVEPQQPFQPTDLTNSDRQTETIEIIGQTIPQEMKEDHPVKADEGILDFYLGDGAQSRIVASINDWIVDKAKTNPGCVERFICEAYKTGETLDGIPYFLMTVSNAAVSFMVAEMFDKNVDMKEITNAARYGRTMGTCHTMECEVIDNNLRNVSDYLGTLEDFISSIFNSISNSINIGK